MPRDHRAVVVITLPRKLRVRLAAAARTSRTDVDSLVAGAIRADLRASPPLTRSKK